MNSHNKITDLLIQKKLLEVIKTQNGIFRTNCIDSLDRSNVVQSVIGRYFLFMILSSVGFSNVKPSDDEVFRKFQGSFELTFKTLWADHGDRLSLAYSGTGALKSDFVRTGKRTLMGNLQDGYLSSKRFYLNNFRDGYNQDCHDYFLGALNPRKRISVVRKVVHEITGHAPYERKVMEILKQSKANGQKLAYKLLKRALGTHRRALRKREELQTAVAHHEK